MTFSIADTYGCYGSGLEFLTMTKKAKFYHKIGNSRPLVVKRLLTIS
jgi:hypothetical protein